MWNEPKPSWRKAQKKYQCNGEECAKVIEPGERYLDRALHHPANSHLRYCAECAEPVLARANGYHAFRGRNDFADRYQQRISSEQWKDLKRHVIEQRGDRCERCEQQAASLELHHLHYHTLGNEQPEEVQLLCPECHRKADEARSSKGGPRREEPEQVVIVGEDGDYVGMLDPDTIYVPLEDGRYLPLNRK